MTPQDALVIRGRETRTTHIGVDVATPACGRRGRDEGFFPMGRVDCTDRTKAVRGLSAAGVEPGELCPLCFAYGARAVYREAYEERNSMAAPLVKGDGTGVVHVGNRPRCGLTGPDTVFTPLGTYDPDSAEGVITSLAATGVEPGKLCGECFPKSALHTYTLWKRGIRRPGRPRHF